MTYYTYIEKIIKEYLEIGEEIFFLEEDIRIDSMSRHYFNSCNDFDIISENQISNYIANRETDIEDEEDEEKNKCKKESNYEKLQRLEKKYFEINQKIIETRDKISIKFDKNIGYRSIYEMCLKLTNKNKESYYSLNEMENFYEQIEKNIIDYKKEKK